MDKRIYILAAGVVMVAGVELYPQFEGVLEAQRKAEILAAGMAPQIELIREIADEANWGITCEGRAGEMSVVRLSPSIWSSADAKTAVYDEISLVASQTQPARATGCDIDLPKVETTQDPQDTALALGPRGILNPYLDIALSCGLTEAKIAPLTEADRARLLQDWYDEIPDDWLAVYSGKSAFAQQGPGLCVAIMASRYENNEAQ